MFKKNNSIPQRQSQFDFILSQQDYDKMIQTQKLYKQALVLNKSLTQQVQTYKKEKGQESNKIQQLIMKVLILSKRLIALQQQSDKLQQQLISSKKKIQTLSKQNRKLMRSSELFNSISIQSSQDKKNIQDLSIDLENIKSFVTQLQEKNQKCHHQNQILKEQNERLTLEIQSNKVQFDKMTKMNLKISKQNTEFLNFVSQCNDKFKKINSLLDNQTFKIDSSKNNLDPKDLTQKKEGKQEQNQIKTYQNMQSIIMQDYSQFTFIQGSLDMIEERIQKALKMADRTQSFKQQNLSLQSGNNALSKRLEMYENRCKILQNQMASQLNIKKVIQNKYGGLKMAMLSGQQINQAMQDLIRKYHDAIDNQYAKILEKIFNQS